MHTEVIELTSERAPRSKPDRQAQGREDITFRILPALENQYLLWWSWEVPEPGDGRASYPH